MSRIHQNNRPSWARCSRSPLSSILNFNAPMNVSYCATTVVLSHAQRMAASRPLCRKNSEFHNLKKKFPTQIGKGFLVGGSAIGRKFELPGFSRFSTQSIQCVRFANSCAQDTLLTTEFCPLYVPQARAEIHQCDAFLR